MLSVADEEAAVPLGRVAPFPGTGTTWGGEQTPLLRFRSRCRAVTASAAPRLFSWMERAVAGRGTAARRKAAALPPPTSHESA